MKLIKFLKDKGLYLLVSFVFSIALFSYVSTTGQSYQNNQAQEQLSSGNLISSLTSQRKVKVNVPLQLDVDDLRYFVTGAPENVSIQLSGPNALVTAAINTKNFEVYANLKNLTLGNHDITLKVRGLSKDISAQIIPDKISINLAQRASRNMPVKIQYNDQNVASGYDVGDVSSSIQNAQVTGSVNQVEKINQVVAQLMIPNNTKKTVLQRVKLQALDVSGNLLDVVISPQTTNVTLPITSGEGKKSVPIVLKPVGKDINNYALTADVNEINVFGNQKVLDGVKQITVEVDVSDVTGNVEKQITIKSFKGIDRFDPKKINVSIQPIKNGHVINKQSGGASSQSKNERSASNDVSSPINSKDTSQKSSSINAVNSSSSSNLNTAKKSESIKNSSSQGTSKKLDNSDDTKEDTNINNRDSAEVTLEDKNNK